MSTSNSHNSSVPDLRHELPRHTLDLHPLSFSGAVTLHSVSGGRVHLIMDEMLQKVMAFPPPQPLSDADYDKHARSLVSLLHQGKHLSGGVELLNVWLRMTMATQTADGCFLRFSVQLEIRFHFFTSSTHSSTTQSLVARRPPDHYLSRCYQMEHSGLTLRQS